MLASRIIPVMLCKGRQLVKGQRFVNDRVVGHALQAARIHAARGVDELLILDVFATADGRTVDLGMIEELTDGIFVPVTVGGGVHTLEQIKALLRAGADKVLIGAAAYRPGSFVEEAAQCFGSQAIVVSVDQHHRRSDSAECVWRASYFAAEGAGEILLNNVDRDGTMQGFDLDLIREVCAAVSVPVIACGGASSYDNIAQVIAAGASAVGVGALFQFEDATPRGAAEYLRDRGVTVRL